LGRHVAFWALALGAGLAAWLFAREHQPAPPPVVLPAIAAASPVPAPPPVSRSAPAPSAPLGPVTFQSGFCADPGEAEVFSTRLTVTNLLQALPADDPARAELQAVLDARERRDADAELHAVRQARQRLPLDPALGWAVAMLTRDSGSLDEAVEGLSVFLAHEASPVLARLRARLEVARDIQRDYQRDQWSGITLLWPPSSLSNTQAHDIGVEVDRALDEAARLIGKPRRKRLTVVVYPSRSELLAVSCAASWSGAIYDGTLRVVAGSEGVDLKTVRHETLHAELSPVAGRAPKWFHEGVAQSFAKQEPRTRTWALMVKNRTWLPFSSLGGSFQVFDNTDAELAYAQSYAMVELMRELGGDAAISTALAAFQEGADTPVALARACGRNEVTGEDLLDFLERRLR
jgi:hypothetical protein